MYYYYIYLYIHFLLKIHWSILLKGIRIPGVDDINQIPISIQKPEKGKSTQVRNIELGMFPSTLSFLKNFILSQWKSYFCATLFFFPRKFRDNKISIHFHNILISFYWFGLMMVWHIIYCKNIVRHCNGYKITFFISHGNGKMILKYFLVAGNKNGETNLVFYTYLINL